MPVTSETPSQEYIKAVLRIVLGERETWSFSLGEELSWGEDYCLLGCDAVQSSSSLRIYQRDL